MGGRKTTDLTGLRFGRLTVLERDTAKSGHAYWRCTCECGETASVTSNALRENRVVSCGCHRREKTIERNTTHGLTAQDSPSLRAYHFWHSMMQRCYKEDSPQYPLYGAQGISVHAPWREFPQFLADMGSCPDGYALKRLNDKDDYGPGTCLWELQQAAQNAQRPGAKRTGAAKAASSTYTSWSNMMKRCYREDDPRYPDWGGRGIRVTEDWHDFTKFLADMGERPEGKTLDRKDNDKDYGPGNCTWSTPREQQANRRVSAPAAVKVARGRPRKLTPEVIMEIGRLYYDEHLLLTAIGRQLSMGRHAVARGLNTFDAIKTKETEG